MMTLGSMTSRNSFINSSAVKNFLYQDSLLAFDMQKRFLVFNLNGNAERKDKNKFSGVSAFIHHSSRSISARKIAQLM